MKVGLFATCLVDLMRPSVGFATVRLLEQAGCEVVVPLNQTCCGQPAYNNGDRGDAAAIARQVIEIFSGFDYVVAPSGSCAGMIKVHYPELFHDDSRWRARAQDLAARTHELTSFLVDVLELTSLGGVSFPETVTYHDSCSSLREMQVKSQPRRLLAQVQGLQLREMRDTETCCGFGGTFCVKYPEISEKMVDAKAAAVAETEASTLLAGDMGCLLNISGRLHRLGRPVRVYHIAEVLAGMTDIPPIGSADPK
jgi:L-lactate dehydrogenase complex protein LldE